MDETALIALGILLEESAISSLEKTGDMVLVEGVEDSEQEEDEENEAESTQEEEVFADAAAATARKRGWSKSMPVSGWEDDEDVLAYERTAEAKGKRRKMTKEGV
ncbi:hypothetical protein KEM55_007215 [Ascosphaera atra]|nr:hypothetical protein KEM55_007215 [Ascosphaera atra]